MKLTEVIAVWELLHVKDVGEVGYCDLEAAIEKICGIVNNVPGSPPSIPYDVLAARVKELEAEVYSLTLWKRLPAAQMQSDPMRAAQLMAKANLDVIETNDRLSEEVKELKGKLAESKCLREAMKEALDTLDFYANKTFKVIMEDDHNRACDSLFAIQQAVK